MMAQAPWGMAWTWIWSIQQVFGIPTGQPQILNIVISIHCSVLGGKHDAC